MIPICFATYIPTKALYYDTRRCDLYTLAMTMQHVFPSISLQFTNPIFYFPIDGARRVPTEPFLKLNNPCKNYNAMVPIIVKASIPALNLDTTAAAAAATNTSISRNC
jgi:hypothetical protein